MNLKRLFSILILSVTILVAPKAATAVIEVSGKLTQFGSPIRFQKVLFKGPGIDTSAVTDGAGNYTIKLYPTDLDGIFVGRTRNCLGDTLSLLKEYGPLTTTATLNFKLCELIQSTTIKGQVLYQGNPLPNAIIRFSFNSAVSKIDSTIADSNGYYIKTLTVVSQPSGLLFASIKNCDGQSIEKSNFYSVDDTCNLDFQYCIGGNFKILTGRVINENIPLVKNDFELYLFEYNQGNHQLNLLDRQRSNFEGVFRFLLTRGNKYIIKAVPKNSLDLSPKYFGSSIHWNKAEVISFNGDSIRQINIPVEPLFKPPGNSDIAGVVKDSRIDRLEPHTIYLLNSASELVGSKSCTEGGRFQFTDLASGEYTLYTDVVGLPTDAPKFYLESNIVNADYLITISNQEVSYEIGTLGFNENPRIDELSTFPTPFENELNINSTFDQINTLIVKDITGKIVHEATIPPFSTSTINTTLWERGVYVIYRFDENQIGQVTKTIKR